MSLFKLFVAGILAAGLWELRAIRKVQTARWDYKRISVRFGLVPETNVNQRDFVCAIRQPLQKPYPLPDTLPEPHEWHLNLKDRD